MNPANYLYIGLCCFFSSAVISLLPLRRIRSYIYILPAFGAASLALAALYLCFSSPGDGGTVIPSLQIPLTSVIGFEFRGDALSGFFTFIISVLSLSVSLYAIGYAKTLQDRRSGGLLFSFFILSMYGVVMSANIITFLVSWETMSIVSYLAVTLDRDKRSAKAGLVYAIMIHIGTIFIIALFLLLYRYSGQMDFRDIRAAATNLPSGIRALVFIFSLLGFGAMAGMIPLHAWLPGACSGAPPHFASLMSGVMVKTGIFGFLRTSMDMLGKGPEWWGVTVIVIGAVSSVGGIFSALRENDLKKLLAYASTGSTGIILLAAGASMIFMSSSWYGLSAVALSAGLYHALNHSLFKGLLFLSAGSVGDTALTKNMDEPEGLLRTMPSSGLFFLVGTLSFCALPPFSGFVSTWLTYQALFPGLRIPSLQTKIAFPLGIAAMALSSALAAATSAKAFRITFPGGKRNSQTEAMIKPSFFMMAGMAVLACLCVIAGLFPDTVMALFSSSVFILTGSTGILGSGGAIRISQNEASLFPTAILAAITFSAVAAMVVGILISKRMKK